MLTWFLVIYLIATVFFSMKHILSSKTDAAPFVEHEIESENERIPYSLDKIRPRQNRAENTKELQTRKVLIHILVDSPLGNLTYDGSNVAYQMDESRLKMIHGFSLCI